MKSLKVVFAGTPAFALPSLGAINNSEHEIIAVYTQPDRPAGRGRQLQQSEVKKWAFENNLPIYQPINFKNENDIKILQELAPDVMVVIAYGLILPEKILQIPKFGAINVHASLLPKWRGASPIQHAILHGDKFSGVSIMQMDKGMDTGDIIVQKNYAIKPNETSASLHDALAKLAMEPLVNTLNNIEHLHTLKQDNNFATYAPKITKEAAKIDWHKTAREIDNQIRAYNPWPIAWTNALENTVRIHQAKYIDEMAVKAPGTIISLDTLGMKVATKDGVIIVERLQFPGGKILSIPEWLNSNRTQLHENLILQ